MADFGGGVNSHSPHQASSPILRAFKWAWFIGSGQMLLKKVSLNVLCALPLPSCHHEYSLKSSYRSLLQKVKSLAKQPLHSSNLPSSQDFGFEVSGTFFVVSFTFQKIGQGDVSGHILAGLSSCEYEMVKIYAKFPALCLTVGSPWMLTSPTALAVDWFSDEYLRQGTTTIY